MNITTGSISRAAGLTVALLAAGLAAPPAVLAGSHSADLRHRLERLEQKLQDMQSIADEVAELKRRLARSEKEANEASRRAQAAESQANAAQTKAEAAQTKAAGAERSASAEDGTDIKWHLAGFGTADFTDPSATGEQTSFGGSFNPIFLMSWRDRLFFEAELEVNALSTGKTKTELEFANLSLQAKDWLTVTAGKFLSPFGDFQQHLHPSWINKLPDRPAGFVEDGGNEPLTEVGVMARGAFPLGTMTADYAVFVGNGPRLSDAAEEGVLLEGFGGDNNNNKAVGGRLGLRPLPYLSLGVSGLSSRVQGNSGAAGTPSSGDYYAVGADAAFTRGPWDVRGEYILSKLDSLSTALDAANAVAPIPGTTWHSWYAQAAYRLAGLTQMDYVRNLEPVFRYSRFTVTGIDEFQSMQEDRWTLGLNYWFTPSAVLKAAYLNRDLHNREDDDTFRLQFAFGF